MLFFIFATIPKSSMCGCAIWSEAQVTLFFFLACIGDSCLSASQNRTQKSLERRSL